jgi:hypothetical protein
VTPATYQALPADVRDELGDGVTLDASIPTGTVRVFGEGGPRDLPVDAFVRARRKARKAERRNRRRGRQR